MKDLFPDLNTGSEVPRLVRDVIESSGQGMANGRGFYQYTEEDAKIWEARFLEFNYKIRRLTSEFSDPPESRKQP
jgi:3-hydroxybutyryl-CoA dehydrogenase